MTIDDPSMTLLELIPVLVAAVAWDCRWSGRRVLILCDNMGVVGAWGRGSGRACTRSVAPSDSSPVNQSRTPPAPLANSGTDDVSYHLVQ